MKMGPGMYRRAELHLLTMGLLMPMEELILSEIQEQ